MKQAEFNDIVALAIMRSENLLLKKGAEYANVENVFHNFDNGKDLSIHNTNVAYAWELTVKHLQSVKDMIVKIEKGEDLSSITEKLLDEKIGDIISYFILMEGMLRKIIKEEGGKNEF